MRKIKEVLRLHHEKKLSDREIAKSVQVGRATVKDYLLRAKKADVGWPLPSELDEASLESLLFPCTRSISPERRQIDQRQLEFPPDDN